MQPVIFVGFIAVFIVIAVLGFISAAKRREAMLLLAQRLGLHFEPHKNRYMARELRFLNKLRHGSNRYAYNILSGNYRGHDVTVFDYHYQTGSGKDTHHHHFSFFTVRLPGAFPELTIGPEGVFSKIAQAVGYDDIDFESHEFSRKFCIRSRDKKFAYDFCHAQMIEYLLANPDLTLEVELNTLAISFNRRLRPEEIEPNLERAIQVRLLMPDYLFTRS